jgi:hypothetical protein
VGSDVDVHLEIVRAAVNLEVARHGFGRSVTHQDINKHKCE